MSWVRLDDGFADHPKVMALGRLRLPCLGVHVAALCYAARHLTDGLVPESFAAQFPDRLVDSLVWAGLWETVDGPHGVKDFRIHDYLSYNPSREAVQGERERARVRMKSARSSGHVRTKFDGSSPTPSPTPPDVLTEHPSDARDVPDGRDDLEAYLLVCHRAPTPRQRKLLDDLLDRHDVNGPAWAAQIILEHPDDPIGAVIEADKAWRAERIAAARTAERKPRPVRRGSGLTGINAELAALLRSEEAEATA